MIRKETTPTKIQRFKPAEQSAAKPKLNPLMVEIENAMASDRLSDNYDGGTRDEPEAKTNRCRGTSHTAPAEAVVNSSMNWLMNGVLIFLEGTLRFCTSIRLPRQARV